MNDNQHMTNKIIPVLDIYRGLEKYKDKIANTTNAGLTDIGVGYRGL